MHVHTAAVVPHRPSESSRCAHCEFPRSVLLSSSCIDDTISMAFLKLLLKDELTLCSVYSKCSVYGKNTTHGHEDTGWEQRTVPRSLYETMMK